VNHLSRTADRIVQQAKSIARTHECGSVGTEHLLLAILREGNGLAAQILHEQGVSEERVQGEIDRLAPLQLHETWVLGCLPGTPDFRDVLSNAVNEARNQGSWQICSVHLLLGLLKEKDSTACKALRTIGVTADTVHKLLEREMAVG